MQLAAKQCAPSPAPQRPGLAYLGQGSFSRLEVRETGQIGLKFGKRDKRTPSRLLGGKFPCL